MTQHPLIPQGEVLTISAYFFFETVRIFQYNYVFSCPVIRKLLNVVFRVVLNIKAYFLKLEYMLYLCKPAVRFNSFIK